MIKILVIFGFLLTSTQFALAGKQCTCSYKGDKIPEGQSACIKTSKGLEMAQCFRVLNNTSWKFLGVPCPSASLEKPLNQSIFDVETFEKLIKNSG